MGSLKTLSKDFARGWGSETICVKRVREIPKREERVCLRMGSSGRQHWEAVEVGSPGSTMGEWKTEPAGEDRHNMCSSKPLPTWVPGTLRDGATCVFGGGHMP